MTQAELAESADVGADRISRYENGVNDIGMTTLLPLLAAAGGANLHDLADILDPAEARRRYRSEGPDAAGGDGDELRDAADQVTDALQHFVRLFESRKAKPKDPDPGVANRS